MIEGPQGDTKTNMIADIPASESHIGTLTGHLDIISDKGRELLKDKVTIELRQANPFVIDIVFGDDALSYCLQFPIPVTKEGSRTRIARTSGYIEVIAPLADSVSSNVSPTSSSLRRSPLLDCQQRSTPRTSIWTTYLFSTLR